MLKKFQYEVLGCLHKNVNKTGFLLFFVLSPLLWGRFLIWARAVAGEVRRWENVLWADFSVAAHRVLAGSQDAEGRTRFRIYSFSRALTLRCAVLL